MFFNKNSLKFQIPTFIFYENNVIFNENTVNFQIPTSVFIRTMQFFNIDTLNFQIMTPFFIRTIWRGNFLLPMHDSYKNKLYLVLIKNTLLTMVLIKILIYPVPLH